MVWTKLKKIAESFIADSLQGRIKYHSARYGNGVSYFMRRGWITFDNRQIANFSTIKRVRERVARTGEWYSEDDQVRISLDEEGFFTRDDFVHALEEYVGLPVEDAMKSSQPIVKAIAMFDRRLGKRRLRSIAIQESEHQLIQFFYKIRLQAEGLESELNTA